MNLKVVYMPKKEFETMRSRGARNSQKLQAALFDTGCCPRFNPAPWQGKMHMLPVHIWVQADF